MQRYRRGRLAHGHASAPRCRRRLRGGAAGRGQLPDCVQRPRRPRRQRQVGALRCRPRCSPSTHRSSSTGRSSRCPTRCSGVDGHPVNALLGAANILLRVAADRSPRAIAICFGAEAAEYRTELFAAYHAQRPPVPDALAWQFEQAPDLLRGVRLERARDAVAGGRRSARVAGERRAQRRRAGR